ncbi:MAG: aspartate--tRNA(Asn) ligase [Candidatus Nanohalarchaeota archaeon]|nr:MAG: aspartate--tRNA(Asn) ligase [Candidatus Nanohaloarchaeota archaeon]
MSKEKTFTADAPLNIGKTITLKGWVDDIRDIGKLIFLILKDSKSKIQIVAKNGVVDDKIIKELKKISKESCIEVVGTVKEAKNAIGGVEIVPQKITVLNAAGANLPIPTDSKATITLSKRLDYRYIDLRNEKVLAIFKIQAVIMDEFRQYLMKKDFIEFNSPGIISSSSEGGADLFSLLYYQKEAFLAQSPQLYKQMAVIGGMERVFTISRIWRAEVSNTVKHLSESRQMDIEACFIDDNEAIDMLCNVVLHIIRTVKKKCARELKIIGANPKEVKGIQRITYDEAIELLQKNKISIKYGEDLGSESEKKICELFKDEPVIVQKWPSALRAFYSMPDEKNKKLSKSFDLLYKGMELASGAQRIHIPELLEKKLREKEMDVDNFKSYIDAFRYGAAPHSGWSIGLERITMAICSLSNIREATLFPRDTERITP